MTELQRRMAVAAVAIPVGIGVIYVGGAIFAALLGMIAALGAREFFAIVKAEGSEPLNGVGITLAAAVPLAVHAQILGAFRVPVSITVVVGVLLLAIALWTRGPQGKPASAVSLTAFGVLYTGGTVSFAYLLRYHDYAVGAGAGTVLLLFPLILTWTCDTAAYSVGRKMGRRKLMPSVSPGKTVEGALAGVLGSVIMAIVYSSLVLRPVAQLGSSLAATVMFGIVISVAAQVGDLAESMLKRSAGVKDSSHLIPGHGGILDRFDSLYFVLPLAYLMLGNMLMPAPHMS
jgi:phosphatidate cytidylyltransferase